jgi:hypothetical protein
MSSYTRRHFPCSLPGAVDLNWQSLRQEGQMINSVAEAITPPGSEYYWRNGYITPGSHVNGDESHSHAVDQEN